MWVLLSIVISILCYYWLFILPWVNYFKELKYIEDNKLYSDMYHMHPSDFEHHIKNLLKSNGYGDGMVSSYVNDFGVDIHLPYAVVQVKKYNGNNKCGRPELMKLEAARTYFNKPKAIFITLSWFTSTAIDYAKQINMELIDCKDILNMIQRTPTLDQYTSLTQRIAKGFI